MTASYALHLSTHLPPPQVITTIFPDLIPQPLPGTDMHYARGRFFLVHGNITKSATRNAYFDTYAVDPQVSLLFFPDGVSDLRKALDELVRQTVTWLHHTQDNVLMLANGQHLVIRRLNNLLLINTDDPIWQPHRLKMIDMTYERGSI